MNTERIRPGDIVLIDGPAGKGSDGPATALARYHAKVLEKAKLGALIGLRVRRLNGGAAFFVRSRLVIGWWQKRKGGTA